MKIDDNNKYNNEFAIKHAFKSLLFTVSFVVLSIYLGNVLLPINITDYLMDYYWIGIIYLIISGYGEYKSYKRFLDVSGHIQNIKEYYRFPISGFKQSIVRGEAIKQIVNKKIDLLKFFSPIPLLIYGIGIYVDDKVFLQNTTSIFSYTFSYKDAMTYGGFSLLIIYVYYLVNLLRKHNRICLEVMRYQGELIFYEELLQSVEKKRRVDYRDTISTLLNRIDRGSRKANTSDNTVFTHRAFAPGPDTKLGEDSEGHFSSREAGSAGHIRTD